MAQRNWPAKPAARHPCPGRAVFIGRRVERTLEIEGIRTKALIRNEIYPQQANPKEYVPVYRS